MPNLRQLTEIAEHPNVLTETDVAMPVKPTRIDWLVRKAKLMRVVKPDISAIEYIVETARPGEVDFVDEGDYYSTHLWRSYKNLSTRYSCS